MLVCGKRWYYRALFWHACMISSKHLKQTLHYVQEKKADEKKDSEGPLGMWTTKTRLTRFRQGAALRCSSMSLKDNS